MNLHHLQYKRLYVRFLINALHQFRAGYTIVCLVTVCICVVNVSVCLSLCSCVCAKLGITRYFCNALCNNYYFHVEKVI